MRNTVGLIVTALLALTVHAGNDEPVCEKTVEDCPNSFFTVNQKTCECECTDLFCIATMSVDTDKCECVPIPGVPDFNRKPIEVFEPTYKCDEDGYRICPENPKSC